MLTKATLVLTKSMLILRDLRQRVQEYVGLAQIVRQFFFAFCMIIFLNASTFSFGTLPTTNISNVLDV